MLLIVIYVRMLYGDYNVNDRKTNHFSKLIAGSAVVEFTVGVEMISREIA